MTSPDKLLATSAKVRLPTIPSTLLAGPAWLRSRRCRSCCATSARTALNTTSLLISQRPQRLFTKPLQNISAGRCTGTDRVGGWRSVWLAELLVFDQKLGDQTMQARVLDLEFRKTVVVVCGRWSIVNRRR